jgi:hypothetical protein
LTIGSLLDGGLVGGYGIEIVSVDGKTS